MIDCEGKGNSGRFSCDRVRGSQRENGRENGREKRAGKGKLREGEAGNEKRREGGRSCF